MELFIFARFHARPGHEAELADALDEVAGPTRAEPGCLAMAVFRSVQDRRLFWVHSRWAAPEDFETHVGLPHTERFVARVERLIDHPLDVSRAERLG